MLDSLRHFLLIAEHGTFTEASRRAHLSQPALTASIQRLEAELGAVLLVRGPGGATLSAAGEALMPWAEATLAAVERGRDAVRAVEGLLVGGVRLAAGGTACAVFLPPVLARFRERHPTLGLELHELTTERVRDGVRSGAYDLGVVTGEGTEPWRDDRLVLVAAPGVDAGVAPHVALSRGSPVRALVDQAFPEATVAMELSSIGAVLAQARAGLGVALVSEAAAAVDLAAGRLVVVPDPRTPIPRALALVHRGEGSLSPAARALRELLLA